MTDKRFNRKNKIKSLINDPYYQPMKQREIGYLMQVAPEDRDEFVEILNELVEEGSIEVSKRGKYMPPSVKTVKGTFSCTRDVYKRQGRCCRWNGIAAYAGTPDCISNVYSCGGCKWYCHISDNLFYWYSIYHSV